MRNRPMDSRAKLASGVLAALSLGFAATVQAQAWVQQVGSDQSSIGNADQSIQDFLSANRGSNGGGDQSFQFGDVLSGTADADLLIGALGVDLLFGEDGDDILIGGTEDFNPFNRDRGFGNGGDDVFIWAPGDGNDFFDGGDGVDVLMLGLIGESTDADGSTAGAPFFNVNPPSGAGSQDFDGIYTDANTGLPVVDVAGGPGFCDIVQPSDGAAEADELAALNLDHLIRFILRGPAADPNNPDTGLRIAIHVRNTEFLVCGGETAGDIEVFDLTTSPATAVDVDALPRQAFDLLR